MRARAGNDEAEDGGATAVDGGDAAGKAEGAIAGALLPAVVAAGCAQASPTAAPAIVRNAARAPATITRSRIDQLVGGRLAGARIIHHIFEAAWADSYPLARAAQHPRIQVGRALSRGNIREFKLGALAAPRRGALRPATDRPRVSSRRAPSTFPAAPLPEAHR